jgi:glycosyltransferase involved in cell wall biosynthesis
MSRERRPRILMVSTVPATLRGFLLPFARHLADRGWRVDAMARGISGCVACVERFHRVWDVDWSRSPFYSGNLRETPRVIRAIVEEQRYDIVHVHTPVAAFVTRFALRRLRRRRVTTRVLYTAHGFHFYRGGPVLRNTAFRTLEAIASRWTDALVVINREDERAARDLGGFPPGSIHYVPGIGVDLAQYDPGAILPEDIARVRRSLGISPDAPFFLAIGECIPRKRHADALAALAGLRHAGAHLAIAGDGPLVDQLRRLAVRLGIQDRVHLLGQREDVPTLARGSAAVLLLSSQEGLPRSVMEAMSLEVPVIGTDVRGTRDLLSSGCGVMVPVGDIRAASGAMHQILADPEKARAMGRRGRSVIATGYSLDQVLAMHDALYADLIGEIGYRRPL